MKVYACPKELPAPESDYRHYDREKELAREEEHKTKVAAWLRKAGYTGPHTGKIYRTPVADGYALYMLGDKGKGGVLIHLPYGDGYNSRDAAFVPKAEVLKRIEINEKMAAMFAAKR